MGFLAGSAVLAGYKKAVILKGDTRPIKQALKELGGRWNGTLGGWVFKADKLEDVRRICVRDVQQFEDRTDGGQGSGGGSAPGGMDAGAGACGEGGAAPGASAEALGAPAPKRVKLEPSQSDAPAGAAATAPPPPPNTSSAAPLSKAGITDGRLELGKSKFVGVDVFGGQVRVDLRSFYSDKDTGELKPTRRGISLSGSEWRKLKANMDTIDRMIAAQEQQ